MKNYYLNLACGVSYDNAIWGVHADSNTLLKIEIKTGVVEYIVTLGKIENVSQAINNMIEYKGKLILIPGNSKFITTYDIQTKVIQYIEYKKDMLIEHFVKFNSYKIYQNYLYLFPYFMKYILKINLDTMEISYIDNWIINFDTNMKFDSYFLTGVDYENYVYLFCVENNFLMRFNLSNEEFQWIRIDNNAEEAGFLGASIQNSDIYLLNKSKEILKYNILSQEVEKVYDVINNAHIYIFQNTIWLFPFSKDEISKYHLDTKHLETFSYPLNFKFTPFFAETTVTYKSTITIDKTVYIVPRCANMLIGIDLEKEKIEYIPISVSSEILKLIHKSVIHKMKTKDLLSEYELSLEDYLLVINREKQQPQIINERNIGKVIFDTINK